MRFRLVLAVVAVLLCPPMLRADGVTVTTNSPGWVQVAPNTFVLPADLSGIGCGSENLVTCEPQGQFNFNVSFATSGTFNILNASGTASDVISFSNSDGHGVVSFSSDPPAPQNLGGPTLCVEDVGTGCTATFNLQATNGTVLTLTAASDGESFFDPFGTGSDTSDGLSVTAVTATPEPGTLPLLASGLLGLAAILRNKFLSR